MSKQKVVLVPGLSYNAALWEAQIEALSKIADFEVYLVHYNSLYETVSDILNNTNGEFSIVGHSLGGWVAMAVAAAAPDRVKRLGVFGGWARGNEGVIEFLTGALEALKGGEGDEFLMNVRAAAIGECDVAAELHEKVAAMQALIDKQHVIAQCEAIIKDNDITDMLPQIKAKTLIVHNEDDNFFQIDEAQYLTDHIASARMAVVEGAGHMSMMQKPKVVTELLRSLLEG